MQIRKMALGGSWRSIMPVMPTGSRRKVIEQEPRSNSPRPSAFLGMWYRRMGEEVLEGADLDLNFGIFYIKEINQ